VTQRFTPNINGNGTHNPLGNDAAMDSSLLQLFGPDEIFERLASKSATGLLHIYNWRDTANIFFKNGLIVAAAKGLTEGEDAVRQAIDLKEPTYVWHAHVTAAMPPYRPIQVAVTDLFDRHAARKASPELKNAALPVAPPPPMPTEIPQPAPPPFLSPGRGTAGMTTALPRLESPMTVQATKPQWPAHATATGATGAPTASGKTAVAVAPNPQQPDLPALKKPQYSFVAIDNPRQRIHLTKESTLVGRNPACDITLDHGSISRQHCLMQVSDRGLHVKDLGTTNGTKINGVNINEGYINPGDQLTMGHLVFILEKD
jgi:hypothetical protein